MRFSPESVNEKHFVLHFIEPSFQISFESKGNVIGLIEIVFHINVQSGLSELMFIYISFYGSNGSNVVGLFLFISPRVMVLRRGMVRELLMAWHYQAISLMVNLDGQPL